MRKINLLILVLGLYLLSFMTPAAAGAESNLSAPVLSETSFRYLTEDGIEIISYVDTWPKDKLPEVAEELYQNRHGLEME